MPSRGATVVVRPEGGLGVALKMSIKGAPAAFAAAATPLAERSGSGAGTLKMETTLLPLGTAPGDAFGPAKVVSGRRAATMSARAFATVSFGVAAACRVAATAGSTAI